MSGSAITIVLLTDHAANKGVGQDAAQQASDWLQRTSGFATAVAGVEVFDIDPAIFPSLEEADAVKAAITSAITASAPAPEPSTTQEPLNTEPAVAEEATAVPEVEVTTAAEDPAAVVAEPVSVESTEAAPGGTADEATPDVVPAPTTEQALTTEAPSTDTPVAQQEPTPVTAEPSAETEPAAAPESVVHTEAENVTELEAAHAAAEVADAAEADAEKAVEAGADVSGVLDNPTA